MADITYDLSWTTKFRYDSITAGDSGKIPRLRVLLADIVNNAPWDALLLGTPRVDDFVHCRVRMDETVPLTPVIDHLKGQLSFRMQDEYPDIEPYAYGRYMWGKSHYSETGNPSDAVIDTWVAKYTKYDNP